MAAGSKISCKQYASYLLEQTPNYDKTILKDMRPITAGMIGFYRSGSWDAYTGGRHVLDRFRSVSPDLTKPWQEVDETDCTQAHCDQPANQIAWGSDRTEYGRERQSWKSQVICFEEVMLKTHAQEHMAQVINDVLRPATSKIMAHFLQRRAFELAGKKVCVCAGLPEFTFTWDAGGNVYLNTSEDPTGRLTQPILESYILPQYAVGAVNAGTAGFDRLQLHTDKDTFRYLKKEDPTILNAWRVGDFNGAAEEFYKYGLAGYVGDFMVKVLMFPLRFNKIASGRYQIVLPYKNVAATNGMGDDFNEDYNRAQYQISYINNPDALEIKTFRPAAVNALMPFMIRDYGGKWKFATNDLGADCNGKPVENYKGNKGLFYADFDLSVKPAHPEWLIAFFHKVDRPCVVIVNTCNDDPGYPSQDYSSDPTACPSVFEFVAYESDGFNVAANTIKVDGNTISHGAIGEGTLAAFIAELPSILGGTWAVESVPDKTFTLTGSTAESVEIPFLA